VANETDRNSNLAGMSAEERRIVIRKIREGASRPDLNVHRIIGIVVRRGTVSRHQLVAEIERVTRSRNASGALASLLTSRGNSYGRVLEDVNGTITPKGGGESHALSP